MQASPILSLSPSFNTCSSITLAEIASRVVEEFRNEQNPDSNFFNWDSEKSLFEDPHSDEIDKNGDFEFAFVYREPNSSPISADEIFSDGKIRPIYHSNPSKQTSHRLPLRKLLTEERESMSCSSSDTDELDSVPAESYCVWTPKTETETTPELCKKRNSTGSSKRWKLSDLLHRSNSDGKETFVFLTAGKKSGKERSGEEKVKVNSDGAGSGEEKGEKRRSLIPYRQDLVGFFANVNGLSRNLHPF